MISQTKNWNFVSMTQITLKKSVVRFLRETWDTSWRWFDTSWPLAGSPQFIWSFDSSLPKMKANKGPDPSWLLMKRMSDEFEKWVSPQSNLVWKPSIPNEWRSDPAMVEDILHYLDQLGLADTGLSFLNFWSLSTFWNIFNGPDFQMWSLSAEK